LAPEQQLQQHQHHGSIFSQDAGEAKKDFRLAAGRMHGPMQSCMRNVLSPCACLHVVMLAGQVLVKMAEAAKGRRSKARNCQNAPCQQF